MPVSSWVLTEFLAVQKASSGVEKKAVLVVLVVWHQLGKGVARPGDAQAKVRVPRWRTSDTRRWC